MMQLIIVDNKPDYYSDITEKNLYLKLISFHLLMNNMNKKI